MEQTSNSIIITGDSRTLIVEEEKEQVIVTSDHSLIIL